MKFGYCTKMFVTFLITTGLTMSSIYMGTIPNLSNIMTLVSGASKIASTISIGIFTKMADKYLEKIGFTNLSASDNLETYCTNLVELAKEGKVREVVGREREINNAIAILCAGDNPCFIGEAGVGKSAIAEGLAVKIAKGEVPNALKDKKIWLLNLPKLKAGNGYSGEYITRIKALIESLTKDRNNILFFDEVHQIIPIADYFKPAMAKGNAEGGLTMLGATTTDEYTSNIAVDPALDRRFTKISVKESTKEETLKILTGLKESISEQFKDDSEIPNILITNQAIEEAVRLSEKYKKSEYFPAKAINLLTESAAYAYARNLDVLTEIEVREYLSLQTGYSISELAQE